MRRRFGSSFCEPGSCSCGVKKTLHAAEQDSEEGRRKRQAWWEQVSQIDPCQLVFLDESGVTTEMTRRYGRALRGERVVDATPAGHWRTLTLIGAISWQGMQTGLISHIQLTPPPDNAEAVRCLCGVVLVLEAQ